MRCGVTGQADRSEGVRCLIRADKALIAPYVLGRGNNIRDFRSRSALILSPISPWLTIADMIAYSGNVRFDLGGSERVKFAQSERVWED